MGRVCIGHYVKLVQKNAYKIRADCQRVIRCKNEMKRCDLQNPAAILTRVAQVGIFSNQTQFLRLPSRQTYFIRDGNTPKTCYQYLGANNGGWVTDTGGR